MEAGRDLEAGGEERFRDLFRHMIDGFAYCEAVYGPDGHMVDWRYLEVNEAFQRLTGLAPAMGKLVTELIPDIRRADPGLFEIYERVAAGGGSERFEIHLASLGEWFSVSVYCPGKGRFVAVFEVITERKRAEAALKESEEKLRCLFQILPVGLSILGRNRELISTNDALSRILRLPEGDLAPALSSRSFVDSAGRPMPIRDFPSVRAAAERRPVENVEIGSVLETGETLWVKVSAVPTPFSDWDIALTVTDIGEQKSTEERLEKALADLELLMKELQHRVKNNLEIVMNLLSFGYEEAMDEGARRVLADARSRVGAMEAIYEALVYSDSFDRIELGLFLERFLESLHETYVIDRESIRFETRIETYEIDHRRAVSLGLILNELVTNALKYAYPRGSGGPIEIDLLKTEEGLRLRVADRGPGLPPGMDPSSSASMGFTLVRLLASQLNSRLEVESAGGSGTQATICIPL